jgi:hypothetical protein
MKQSDANPSPSPVMWKKAGNFRDFYSVNPLLAPKDREITLLFQKIPWSSEQGNLGMDQGIQIP